MPKQKIELEDQATAVELIELDDDIAHLETKLLELKARRDQLMAKLNDQLTAIGVRSTWVDYTRVTVARTPRWSPNPVTKGVAWAIKHGHNHVLTVKDREFSAEVDKIVLAHGAGIVPDWITRFNLLTLRIKKER